MPLTETKPNEQVPAEGVPSPESKPAESQSGAPESYADFTAPEGTTLNADAIKSASSLFKELGLNQAQAQKLVDFAAKQGRSDVAQLAKAYTDMRQDWRTQLKADPEIGSKLPEVQETVGRVLDGLGDPKLATEVRAALDLTGAGDHPAIVKAFYKLAQKVVEPKHVNGAGPSPEGQRAPGTNDRPSLAQAMYPNLRQ